MIASPMFSGNGYLHYTDEEVMRRLEDSKTELDVEFRSFAPQGVLVWTGTGGGDRLSLQLRAGRLELRLNLGSGEARGIVGAELGDGRWHRLRLIRSEQEAELSVDGGPAVTCRAPGPLRQLNTHSGLYLGTPPSSLYLHFDLLACNVQFLDLNDWTPLSCTGVSFNGNIVPTP
ncbi:BC067074 [Cordylochernes scorpioides]|uniref:BC067074 n=1 Tax=Cordylochernes scorpioides TaxID=51811 RepID=A0ABY6KEF3_9ARAC|nr:BC067074 [Cordylochernes scorpioides]